MVNNSIVVIKTERLDLRRMRPDDLAPLMDFLSDPLTMIHYPRPWDRAKVQRWIERAIQSYELCGFGMFAVVLRETGEVIGDCGFTTQEVEGRMETELGYHMARRYWHSGYGAEAACACRDYAFRMLGLPRLISLILPLNLPSRRVAEKVGMTIEAETMFHGARHYVYSIASEFGKTNLSTSLLGRVC